MITRQPEQTCRLKYDLEIQKILPRVPLHRRGLLPRYGDGQSVVLPGAIDPVPLHKMAERRIR